MIPVMWVFTYKFDTDGFLDKFKARLVVRRDLQPITGQDNYAATLAARVFRCLIAIAAQFDLDIHQLDAVNAFTNSDLDEAVYIRFPDRFEDPGFCIRTFTGPLRTLTVTLTLVYRVHEYALKTWTIASSRS